MADKTPFLSRWSQRKIEQQNLDAADASNQALALDDPASLTPSEPQNESVADVENEIVLTDADMPDIESLNESSNFSQFFSSGVSEELRDLALQKLFRLPEFNLRDGLNDYDEDFSKMTALTEAVASQLRKWVEEKTEEKVEEQHEQIKSQLSEASSEQEPSIQEPSLAASQSDTSTTHTHTTTIENDNSTVSTTNTPFSSQDQMEDDLGDADLEG